MKIMEKFGVPEPQWILDRADSGLLFWRREGTGNNRSRVKFLCEVDVKEFYRADHELDDIDADDEMDGANGLVQLMTGVFCVAVTVMLPWYIIGIN